MERMIDLNKISLGRLQKLAGIVLLEEVSMEDKEKLYSNSYQRIPFDRSLMKSAIERGEQVGITFQSNNSKYKMPTVKYRVINPVCMGIGKSGELLIRAQHVIGQSEREAIRTGIRSAEVEDQWRLFKAKNIKGMFLTGNYFHGPMPNYNPNDKGMISIEVAIDFAKAKAYQDELVKQAKEKENIKKPIVPLFKAQEQQPVKPISTEVPVVPETPKINKAIPKVVKGKIPKSIFKTS